MARRWSQQTDQDGDGDGVMPARLRRYQPAEWLPEVEHLPIPDYWGDNRTWPRFHGVRAFRAYLDARRAWLAEHEQGPGRTHHQGRDQARPGG